MAMSQLLSGGDKGPNNPLAKLSSQMNGDRGAQRDTYGGSQAGPSRQSSSFRTPHQPSSSSSQQKRLSPSSQGAFDVSSLAHALHQPAHGQQQHGRPGPAASSAGWATSFLQHQGQQMGHSLGPAERAEMDRVYQNVQRGRNEGGLDWRNDFIRFERDNAASLHLPPDHVAALDRAFAQAGSAPQWAARHPPPHQHFQPHHHQPRLFNGPSPQSEQRDSATATTAPSASRPDLTSSSLAETATLLLDSVNEQTASSPDQAVKFQNSAFMGLMRQFKDGSADVKGEELVQQQATSPISREGEEGWAQAFSTPQSDRTAGGTMNGVDKGKGRAQDQDWSKEFLDASTSASTTTHHHDAHPAYSETYLYPQATGYGHSPLPHHLTSQHQHPLQSTSAKTVSSWDAQFDAVSSSLDQQPEKLFADQALGDERLQRDTHVTGQSSAWEESVDQVNGQDVDLGDMQDEEVFGYYQGSSRMPMKGRSGQVGWAQGMRQSEIDANAKMSEDWDTIGGQQTGLDEGAYVFQEGNPWIDEQWARISSEGDAFQSVLEQEARVLRDPGNAQEWYDLGVKQQEHERESLAILALEKSISLNPSDPSPYLALAVSHTNNNDRTSTFSTLEAWITHSAEANPLYVPSLAAATESRLAKPLDAGSKERFDWIVSVLVGFARAGAEMGEVDADVQVALGVLFNTSGEFTHAQDCFRTALQVRPDDWSLLNRLGATLANGGDALSAHTYYYRALDLRPSFVRARFNLGISCINLKRYEEAAGHILTALRLQKMESTAEDELEEGTGLRTPGGRGSGMSDTLWETLRNACGYMGRSELVELCARRDLGGFEGVEESFGGDPIV